MKTSLVNPFPESITHEVNVNNNNNNNNNKDYNNNNNEEEDNTIINNIIDINNNNKDYNNNNEEDDEDDIIILQGTGGTPEDQHFDTIIGIIEQFMFDINLKQLIKIHLPLFSSISSDHDKYILYKKYIKIVDDLLDFKIKEEIPEIDNNIILELVSSRKNEISDEVDDFVNNGCLEYESFITLWGEVEEG